MAGDDVPRTLRADDRAGASLAERLSQRIARLFWRTPLHGLRLRGRYPLQLVAVPADPIPGSARAGRALLAGRMDHAGESVAIAALDTRGGFGPAFADHWQSFAWLRDLAAAVPHEEGAAAAEALTRAWLAAHGKVIGQAAWRPDLWGRRILMWTAYAPYILASDDQAYRKEVLNALARGARHLDRAADGVAPGSARIAAWAGVIAAGLLIPGGDLRTAHGEAGLTRALADALYGDGGLAARSPTLQLDLVELLSQLRAIYAARARPLPGTIARALAQATPALIGVTLGDGALSSWQGGGPASARRVAAAVAASGVTPRALGRPSDWGYQRLAQGAAALIVDAGPPPVVTLGQSGCASTLAFELSDARRRLIVNCGGGPGLPAALVRALRTTAAHSTLTLADTNSTAIHPDGALGKGVTEVSLERRDTAAGALIEATHDGYAKRRGLLHRRLLTLAADGRSLEGEDRLLPVGRRRVAARTPFAIRFHLAPGIETVPTADGRGALLRPDQGAAWQFRAGDGVLTIEESVWVDGGGRPLPSRALVIGGEATSEGAMIGWSLRRLA